MSRRHAQQGRQSIFMMAATSLHIRINFKGTTARFSREGNE